MEPKRIEKRLEALEEQLARLEALIIELGQKIEGYRIDTAKAAEGIKKWVTDYVAMRLEQLVPETCEHLPEAEAAGGPYLPGTSIRCTEEVIHRIGRIPIPFVRQMVVQKVAQQARQEGIERVDIRFFERAATF